MLAAGNKNGFLYVLSEANLEADGGYDSSHVQAIQLNTDIDDLGLGGLFGTPTYSPATNMLYVVDSGPGINGIAGGLIALSVQPDCSLKVAWSRTVGTANSNSPNSTATLANGVLFVGVNDGSVSAFDAATGAALWNSGSKGFAVYAAPTVANGTMFAGVWSGASASDTGTVRAWSIPDHPGACP
jgi:outer membrane protein assembly factor BamB